MVPREGHRVQTDKALIPTPYAELCKPRPDGKGIMDWDVVAGITGTAYPFTGWGPLTNGTFEVRDHQLEVDVDWSKVGGLNDKLSAAMEVTTG